MGSSTDLARTLYRTLVPGSVRKSAPAARLRERFLGHDRIYDAAYFQDTVEGPAARSAGRISESILGDLTVGSAIDVGCGTGALLEALRDRGCEVFGLEYAQAGLAFCRARGLNVEKFDLERKAFSVDRTFDVAISLEVAEHLHASRADRFVDTLTCLSRVVVFTAAHPGQGGTDHVNEQPKSYWIEKFGDRGFEYDEALAQRWRASWLAAGDVQSWYFDNIMVFRRTDNPLAPGA